MYNSDLAKAEFNESITFFKADIANLRTGRVSPSLVEGVKVEAYNSLMELVQLASISSPEPRSIMIQPWDKTLTKNIESALNKSELNLNPIVDKDNIRINFPPLTEENRKALIKLLHQKAEGSKVTLKQKREKIKETIVEQEKKGELSEDEKFMALEKLDVMIKEYNEEIRVITEAKENEIMTV